jgi:hypothetical protein
MAATDPKYCVPAMRSFYEPRAMGEWKRTDRKNAHYIVFVVLIYLQITFYEPISLLIKRTKFLAGESFEPDQPLCKIGATLRRTVDVEIWDPPNGIPIPSLPSPPPTHIQVTVSGRTGINLPPSCCEVICCPHQRENWSQSNRAILYHTRLKHAMAAGFTTDFTILHQWQSKAL